MTSVSAKKMTHNRNESTQICAPRWKQDLFDGIRSNWYMNGMCLSLLSSHPTNRYHHVPLLDGNHQVIEFHRDTLYFYGMGQAGFSAVATPSELVVGAPGMFYWTGTALQLGERSLRDQQAGLIPKVIGDSRLETHGYFGELWRWFPAWKYYYEIIIETNNDLIWDLIQFWCMRSLYYKFQTYEIYMRSQLPF